MSNSRQGSAGLSRSASDPGLLKKSSSLSASGAMLIGEQTTTLYEKQLREGKFRDRSAHIRASGGSVVIPLADSAGRDVQPEIYFPAPATPPHEKKFRKLSLAPGEIKVHHGLKGQRLPPADFPFGIRGVKGNSVEATMKAGQLVGVAEYKNSVQERIYESVQKEPLGKPCSRNYKNVKMLSEGYGKPSAPPEGAKNVIFPVSMPRDTEEQRILHRRSHNSFDPGEQHVRNYNWPEEALDPWFAFGVKQAESKEGEGAKMVLNTSVDDNGSFKKTRFVQRDLEEYRNIEQPHIGVSRTMKGLQEGSMGPPVKPTHAYGVKSSTSEVTAGSCINGYYSLPEQLPDQDLGRCNKPGRRNLTSEVRAFGLPSVRTDIAPPDEQKRSLADMMNYGDEFGVASLVNPQRFEFIGIPDKDFLLRRPREELQELVEACGHAFTEIDFDEVWDRAVNLFGDGLELVSLDAFLYLFGQFVDAQVHERKAGAALKGTAAQRLGMNLQF